MDEDELERGKIVVEGNDLHTLPGPDYFDKEVKCCLNFAKSHFAIPDSENEHIETSRGGLRIKMGRQY